MKRSVPDVTTIKFTDGDTTIAEIIAVKDTSFAEINRQWGVQHWNIRHQMTIINGRIEMCMSFLREETDDEYNSRASSKIA